MGNSVNVFVEKIKKYAKSNHMFDNCDVVVTGFSGGTDSTCLINVLAGLRKEYGFVLAAVHVNHQIRGEQADADEAFVKEICEKLDIKLMSVREDVHTLAKDEKITVEEAGRKVRYRAFESFAENFKSVGMRPKIAVAHNMNDNAETVMFNLFRGSGLTGIGGIRPVNGDIIRPLMCVTRKEIEDYLDEMNINYCTDSTNLTCDYTRNITRLKLLPVIENEINTQAVRHISETSAMVLETENFVNNICMQTYERLVTRSSNSVVVNRQLLAKEDIVIRKRVIRKMIETLAGRLKDVENVHVMSCINLCQGETGKSINLVYNLIAETEYENLRIRIGGNSEDSKAADEMCITKEELKEAFINNEIIETKVSTGTYFIKISPKNNENEWKNDYTKCFDYDNIKCDIFLRHRRNGDYIVINENGTSKKIKDYFINEKVPKDIRDELVMVAAGSQILWIPGYRSGESAHVTHNTKTVLTVSFEMSNTNTEGNAKEDGEDKCTF